jgi:hypothetical protein
MSTPIRSTTAILLCIAFRLHPADGQEEIQR